MKKGRISNPAMQKEKGGLHRVSSYEVNPTMLNFEAIMVILNRTIYKSYHA